MNRCSSFEVESIPAVATGASILIRLGQFSRLESVPVRLHLPINNLANNSVSSLLQSWAYHSRMLPSSSAYHVVRMEIHKLLLVAYSLQIQIDY